MLFHVNAMDSDLDTRLTRYRKGLLARIWAGGVFIALIALATSVVGKMEGRQYFDLTIVLMIAFIIAYVLRKKIPYEKRVAATVFVVFGTGLANFIERGMFGASFYLFVLGILIAAMLYSVRAGIIGIGVASIVLIVDAVGFINGWITPAYDFNLQAVDPLEWIMFFTVVILASSLMLYAIGSYVAAIRELLTEVHDRGEETRKALDELKQSQAQVVQLEKLASLGSLVAGVAHELNTPIGNATLSISAMQDRLIEMQSSVARGDLRRSALDSFLRDTIELAAMAATSCKRAGGLVSSFKQIAVDQTSAQRRQFLLGEVIGDVLTTLKPSYQDSPWEIGTAIPSETQLDSYPGPLGHVIANLVQNALIHAFTGRKSGSVWITAVERTGMVVITVEDNGLGIDASAVTQIFDPFFTGRLGQGTSGLGLSVAHNIAVGILGGTLHASSKLNEGSSFVLSIPLVAPIVSVGV